MKDKHNPCYSKVILEKLKCFPLIQMFYLHRVFLRYTLFFIIYHLSLHFSKLSTQLLVEIALHKKTAFYNQFYDILHSK